MRDQLILEPVTPKKSIRNFCCKSQIFRFPSLMRILVKRFNFAPGCSYFLTEVFSCLSDISHRIFLGKIVHLEILLPNAEKTKSYQRFRILFCCKSRSMKIASEMRRVLEIEDGGRMGLLGVVNSDHAPTRLLA
jgi:hypothetical protein